MKVRDTKDNRSGPGISWPSALVISEKENKHKQLLAARSIKILPLIISNNTRLRILGEITMMII
ncbi:MAG: hypothetical protein ACI83D_000788 [Planctomycetota bacterium]|jgi:hypothetical protein